jgi:hypothetical protein
MTLRTTIVSTTSRVDFEIPAQMVGKEIEIVATEKAAKRRKSLTRQYKEAATENKELAKEFKAIDMEGWENEY